MTISLRNIHAALEYRHHDPESIEEVLESVVLGRHTASTKVFTKVEASVVEGVVRVNTHPTDRRKGQRRLNIGLLYATPAKAWVPGGVPGGFKRRATTDRRHLKFAPYVAPYVSPDPDRRSPSRTMYHYATSEDPRIRSLERRVK